MKEDIQELKKMVEDFKKDQAKFKSFMSTYKSNKEQTTAPTLSFAGIDDPEQHLKDMSAKLENLEARVIKLVDQAEKLEKSVDDLEQYGRSNCLILHGCDEKKIPPTSGREGSYNKFLDYLLSVLNRNLKLDFTITKNDIDIAHVLPGKKRGTVPIIMKFVRRSVRHAVFNNKRHLKSVRLAITESLTRRRLQIVKSAKQAFGDESVWTVNGNVYTVIDGKRQVLNFLSDIDKFGS